MASQARQTPKDAMVMMAILKDMGILEYEPRVINQLLEFTYRYVTNILDDARVYANHAKKKNIDVDDVKLAVQMLADSSITTPPPRDILLEVARSKNSLALPLIKPHCGIYLPPDRYCLSACNYRLRNKKPTSHALSKPHMGAGSGGNLSSRLGMTSIGKPVGSGSNSKPSLSFSQGGGGSGVSSKPKAVLASSVPKPVIKVSAGSSMSSKGPKQTMAGIMGGGAVNSAATVSVSTMLPVSQVPTVRMDLDMTSDQSLKRKREDDDFDASM